MRRVLITRCRGKQRVAPRPSAELPAVCSGKESRCTCKLFVPTGLAVALGTLAFAASACGSTDGAQPDPAPASDSAAHDTAALAAAPPG